MLVWLTLITSIVAALIGSVFAHTVSVAKGETILRE
jgi:hypothetical protein